MTSIIKAKFETFFHLLFEVPALPLVKERLKLTRPAVGSWKSVACALADDSVKVDWLLIVFVQSGVLNVELVPLEVLCGAKHLGTKR